MTKPSMINDNKARIKDPKKLLPPEVLAQKENDISVAMVKMFRRPIHGGNPFLYMFTVSKLHEISDSIETAATNGKIFYWGHEFIQKLNRQDIVDVMFHETYHIALNHTLPGRNFGKNHMAFNEACDLLDNGLIEEAYDLACIEAKGSSELGCEARELVKPFRSEVFGRFIDLATYIAWIDGQIEHFPPKPPGTLGGFSDKTITKRSAESVYNEIWSHTLNSPRRCKACGSLGINPKTGKPIKTPPFHPLCCPICGQPPGSMGHDNEGFDTHIDSVLSKEQVEKETIRAAMGAKNICRGTLPSGIESILKELKEPTLKPHQIAIHSFQRKSLDVGSSSDYSRIKRRPAYLYERNNEGSYVPIHRIFQPKKHTHSPKYIYMQDTSGSMSDEAISATLKEVKIVASIEGSEGYVIPVDAVPYWDKMTLISEVEDLKRVSIVGRGGTAFSEFFKDLPLRFGRDLDLVIVGTDGMIDVIDKSLAPPCDVLWIIVGSYDKFVPPFGRCVNLDPHEG